MAWTSPMTATTNQTLTAAQWNANVRDNMNETEAGKATYQGRYMVATGTNAIAERSTSSAYNNTAQSTTSTAYTDLATSGPSVTSTTGTSALVFWNCAQGNTTTTAQTWVSVEVTGDSTVAASDTWGSLVDGTNGAAASTDNLIRHAGFHRFTGLTAGSNTFRMRYRVSAGTGWFSQRAITVVPL